MTSAERLKRYEDLFAKSQAYNPAAFQAGFEKDYEEATNYNKDLIDQRAAVIGEMQSLPAQLRAQYATSGIRNPLEQEALIAQRRGIQTADLNRLTDFLAARGSRYEDVLGKHLQAYLADQSAAERAAENAWRAYQDAVQQDQFSRQLAASRSAANPSGSLGKIIEALLGGGKGETPTEVTPQQQVLNAIDNIAKLRKSSNIESKMNQYHREIMNLASSKGLTLSSEALWQRLGNDIGIPQTLILFR